MAELTFNRVRKVYAGDVEAVKGFDLDVADAEFIVLVGPSGCGKSTTLRMIAGLEDITSGTISIGERVVNDIPPKKRDIAMVFQNYALYPHMTVYKNLAFALKLQRVPRAEIDQRVHEAAKVLGIEELLERKPKALSGGQRQRVAVGRAIVRAPKAYLFDEPLSNLDAKLRVEMRAELKRLHARLSTTTVYVTHDQEEAMTLGDRIVVMNDGEIQQCAPPLTIYNNPSNRFVAGFIGTPPMNFCTGRFENTGDTLSYVDASMRLQVPEEFRAKLGPHAGEEVVCGIRPEAVSLHPEGRFQGTGNTFEVEIDVVEPLGEQMDLAVTAAGGQPLVVRTDAEEGVERGQRHTLHLDMGKVRFFEPGPNGRNLLY